MAKCRKCGRKSLFLKVNANGLCDICQNYQSGTFFQSPAPKIMNLETRSMVAESKTQDEPISNTVKMEVLKRAKGRKTSLPLTGIINQYSDDIPRVIAQLEREGLLARVSLVDDLSLLPIPQLKEILKNSNLKVSGKKSELIERIHDNIWMEELLENFPFLNDKIYIVTDKGKAALNVYAIDVEMNLRKIEDECFSLICRNRIGDAYKCVERYESEQTILRGSEKYWESENHTDLSEAEAFGVYCFMKSHLELPPDLSEYEDQMKSILVTAYFIGRSASRLGPLTERILRIPATEIERDSLSKLYQDTFSLICSGRDLFKYKRNKVQQYSFMACLDEKTCSVCGMLDMQILNVDEARIGVNYPPMHSGCRCTTNAYYGDGLPNMRRAQNLVTGESELIESISWSEWTAKNKK